MIWISIDDALPPEETPVLIVRCGTVRIGEIRWEHPGFEDTYRSFRYWDDPHDDGQAWDWDDVAFWMPLPELPK